MLDTAVELFPAFDASDEAMHQPGSEAQWNESMLFHMVEKNGSRGLLLRIGQRPNEGHAEVTVSQLFADGSIAVDISRTPLFEKLSSRAGGLQFIMIEPLKLWRCKYSGTVSILRDGRDLKNPKNLGSAEKRRCEIDLLYEDIIPVFGATPDGSYVSAETINKRHYEGIASVSGTILLGDETVQVEGFGFRDHSWGVRDWQSIDFWRWCYGQYDRGNIFSICILQAGGASQVTGVLIRNGQPERVTDVAITSRYSEAPDHYLEEADIRIPAIAGDFTARLTSRCKMPLRNRKGEQVFRMVENLAFAEMEAGTGFGWIEAADRIVDGVPLGNLKV